MRRAFHVLDNLSCCVYFLEYRLAYVFIILCVKDKGLTIKDRLVGDREIKLEASLYISWKSTYFIFEVLCPARDGFIFEVQANAACCYLFLKNANNGQHKIAQIRKIG